MAVVVSPMTPLPDVFWAIAQLCGTPPVHAQDALWCTVMRCCCIKCTEGNLNQYNSIQIDTLNCGPHCNTPFCIILQCRNMDNVLHYRASLPWKHYWVVANLISITESVIRMEWNGILKNGIARFGIRMWLNDDHPASRMVQRSCSLTQFLKLRKKYIQSAF